MTVVRAYKQNVICINEYAYINVIIESAYGNCDTVYDQIVDEGLKKYNALFYSSGDVNRAYTWYLRVKLFFNVFSYS